MSSGSSARSTSSSLISTVPTSSQHSLHLGVKPGLSASSPGDKCSFHPSGSASASLITGSYGKSDSLPTSSSSPLKSSPLSTVNGKSSNANLGAQVAEHEGKSKSRKGCINGIKFDFRYRNMLTASGRGRSTLGTGSGAPVGCDIM